MTRNRRTVFLTHALIPMVMACMPPAAMAQAPVCLTEDPTAAVLVGSLRKLYADPAIDSTSWKNAGFPFATGSAIALETSDSVCSLAVTAYNLAAGIGNTPEALSQAYVARIGATGYVVSSPRAQVGEWRTRFWFDTAWVFKQVMKG